MPAPAEVTAPPPNLLITRVLARASRSRWYVFLRHVYRYQNGSGPGSELSSSPFNSPAWLTLELVVLLTQITATTVVLAVSKHEIAFWPLRIWIFAYNVANVLNLPLLYWRHRHAAETGNGNRYTDDVEQGRNDEFPRTTTYLMNKSRACLELFYAMWFVMGNVWVFDVRLSAFSRAPRLHALCVGLLAWNALLYALPFLLFLLLCCFVPTASYVLGYNMNLASVERGASDEELSELPRWRFKGGDKACDHHRDENAECCICLNKYKERDELRQLPCSHVFHQRCVDRWLRIISSCPLCKQDLKLCNI